MLKKNNSPIWLSLGSNLARAGWNHLSAELHLDPLPFFAQDGAVKVARAHALDSSHDQSVTFLPA